MLQFEKVTNRTYVGTENHHIQTAHLYDVMKNGKIKSESLIDITTYNIDITALPNLCISFTFSLHLMELQV